MLRGLATVLFLALSAQSALAQTTIRPGVPTHLPESLRQGPSQFIYTARTQSPVRRSGDVVVLGVHWTCEGTTCTATGPWPRPLMPACVVLVRAIGPIVSLGRDGVAFTDAQVQRCNTAASSTPRDNPIAPPAVVTTNELSAIGGAVQSGPQPPATLSIETLPLIAVGGSIGAGAPPPPTSITTPQLSAIGG